MNEARQRLKLVPISDASVYCSTEPAKPAMARSLESLAIEVMTDFEHDHPITISPGATVEEARNLMQAGRVRMLIVANDDGDFRGLIRSSDVAGPASVVAAHDLRKTRDDVIVSDVMRPKQDLLALDVRDLETLAIGEIIEALRQLGEPDIMVLDGDDTRRTIRGLLSVSDIAREVRIDFDLNSHATTFADLEKALNTH